MLHLRSKGSFKHTESYLNRMLTFDIARVLARGGQKGVDALSKATPVETGLSANSWTYKIERTATSCSIVWSNTDVESGFPVAIALQYGYATGTGGYVQGRDYINPAMKPVFDAIEADVRKAVTSFR